MACLIEITELDIKEVFSKVRNLPKGEILRINGLNATDLKLLGDEFEKDENYKFSFSKDIYSERLYGTQARVQALVYCKSGENQNA